VEYAEHKDGDFVGERTGKTGMSGENRRLDGLMNPCLASVTFPALTDTFILFGDSHIKFLLNACSGRL
jgi:hypothetical protein